LIENAGALHARLDDKISLRVPKDREAHYRPHLNRDLTLGLRPEHLTEAKAHAPESSLVDFVSPVEVTEPMGVDTMVFVNIQGIDICARCEPRTAKGVGVSMTFSADMSHMHLLDPQTDRVL
jgi:multiple sugar transport system ATP-binding protein